MGIFGVFKKKVDIPEPPREVEEQPLELPPLETPELPDIRQEMQNLPEITMSEIKIPEVKARPTSPKQVFVSVQDYEMILNSLSSIREKLAATDNYVKELQHLKQQHDKELEGWRVQLDDTQRKLTYVDEVLFQAG